MSNNQGSLYCTLGGWGLAILAGILAAILLMLLGDWRFIQGVFAGIVIAIILGALMSWIVCRPLPHQGELRASGPANPVATNEESAAAAAVAAREGAKPSPASAPAAAASAAKAGVKASAPLAGEAELAERKGEWKYEAPAKAAGTAAAAGGGAAAASAAADKAAADKAAADKAAAEKAAAATAASDKAASESAVPDTYRPQGLSAARGGKADDLKQIKGVGPKMETMLNGMGYYHFDQVAEWGDNEVAWVDDNLEGFKGRVTRDRWVPQARLLASGQSVSDDVLEKLRAGEDVDLTDYDGDGVSEGTMEGKRPTALDGPRGGKADNLKEIKGIGPKLELLCHTLGFFHFDQIAAWTADEVAWVDANLEGFKGRVTRDTWVEQAKILAAGGATEFSKRVDDGDVY